MYRMAESFDKKQGTLSVNIRHIENLENKRNNIEF